MKCPKCGNLIIFKKNFCPACGEKLENETDKFNSDIDVMPNEAENFNTFDEVDEGKSPQPAANDAESYETEQAAAFDNEQSDLISDSEQNDLNEIDSTATSGESDFSDDEMLQKQADSIKLKIAIFGGAAVVILAFIVLIAFAIFGNNGNKPAQNVSGSEDIDIGEAKDTAAEYKSAIDAIKEQFYSGEKDYETAKRELYAYYDYNEVTDYCKEALDEIFEENDYRVMLQNAQERYASGDFEGALGVYAAILEKRPESEEAKTGFENSAAEYRNSVFAVVDESVSSDEYDTAIDALNAALQILPDDEEIKAKLSDTESKKQEYLHKKEMEEIVANARAKIQKGNWDDAYEDILEALKKYPGDEILTEYKKKVRSQMPITLYNIDLKDSHDIYRSKHHIEDKNGKDYKNYVRFNATKSAEAVFILNGDFKKFTAKMFVDPEATSGKNISIWIEVDGETVQMQYMTETHSTKELEIDLTGKKLLKIHVINEGTADKGYLIIADTSFERK